MRRIKPNQHYCCQAQYNIFAGFYTRLGNNWQSNLSTERSNGTHGFLIQRRIIVISQICHLRSRCFSAKTASYITNSHFPKCMEIVIDQVCSTAFSRARGLMFSPRKTLLFTLKRPQRVLLHMWFVFYPIDILFLDKARRIVEIKQNFRPFSLYRTKEQVSSFIEIPAANSLYKLKTGEKIIIKKL